MGQSRPLFVYFRYFLDTISIIQIDGVLGIRTRGRRMVGADETTELWRPPILVISFKGKLCCQTRGSTQGGSAEKGLWSVWQNAYAFQSHSLFLKKFFWPLLFSIIWHYLRTRGTHAERFFGINQFNKICNLGAIYIVYNINYLQSSTLDSNQSINRSKLTINLKFNWCYLEANEITR